MELKRMSEMHGNCKDCNAPARSALYGVPLSSVTRAQWLTEMETAIGERSGKVACTANIDFIVKAGEDIQLREILCRADWVLCDGTPVKWLSRLTGPPLPERLAGSDMVPHILNLAHRKGFSVFVLGGREEVNSQALEKIRKDYPGISRVDGFAPKWAPLESMPHDQINQKIRECSPDILMVCLGCPKQEKWIDMNRGEWTVGVALGLGACVDFMAGTRSRSPQWMRRSGLEWAYRLMQEPRRLCGRYVRDIAGMGRRLITQFRRRARHGRDYQAGAVPIQMRYLVAGDRRVLRLGKSLQAGQCKEVWQAYGLLAVRPGGELELDVSELEHTDSWGMGLMISFWRDIRQTGGTLVILNAPAWLTDLVSEWGWVGLPGWEMRTADINVNDYHIAGAQTLIGNGFHDENLDFDELLRQSRLYTDERVDGQRRPYIRGGDVEKESGPSHPSESQQAEELWIGQ